MNITIKISRLHVLVLILLISCVAWAADTKISALAAASAAAAGNEYPINEAGTSKKVTGTQIKTFVNTANVFAAGSASAGTWPVFTSGTVLTSAEDGAVEFDGDAFYLTTDTGNRGYVPVRHLIRQDSARTLANSGSSQAIFNSVTNGRITLETGTYKFEGQLVITSMSSTSGNMAINPLGAGTATVGAWLWSTSGLDNSTLSTGAAQGGAFNVAAASGTNVVTAGTGTGLGVRVSGMFEVTGAGTMIPSLTLTTAIGTASLAAGSYWMFERVSGSTSLTNIGQWD